ncbi:MULTISPECIES: ATP/GTP-binding protein [Rhodoluna]|uniref:ATP/GTP-binding protein n=1 Tax=Rhodoluna TaxID=529883 RepID=UPI0011069DFA|nr:MULTISPECIES: ATP/GTP-binding protein [Rhodoluna]
MPRSNRSRRAKPEVHEELEFSASRYGIRNVEVKRGVEYTTQTSVGANADDGKSWTCPNCNLQINKGLSHIVAWDSVRGVDTRRHFHNACWKQFQGPLL